MPKAMSSAPAIKINTFVFATWIDVSVSPIAAAKIPSIIKIREKPAKNTRVIFVISFFSLNVYAKKAGSIARVHGNKTLMMPPRKATKNESF